MSRTRVWAPLISSFFLLSSLPSASSQVSGFVSFFCDQNSQPIANPVAVDSSARILSDAEKERRYTRLAARAFTGIEHRVWANSQSPFRLKGIFFVDWKKGPDCTQTATQDLMNVPPEEVLAVLKQEQRNLPGYVHFWRDLWRVLTLFQVDMNKKEVEQTEARLDPDALCHAGLLLRPPGNSPSTDNVKCVTLFKKMAPGLGNPPILYQLFMISSIANVGN